MAQTSLITFQETDNQTTFKNDKETILFYLRNHFLNGATQEDFEPILNKNKHCFSGRFTKLIEEKRIFVNGKRMTIDNGKKRTMNVYYSR